MKKILIPSIILLISVYIIRLVYINRHTYAPNNLTYKLLDEVKIEEDFFDDSTEDMNGYSVKVINSKILTIDELKENYEGISINNNCDYVIIVSAEFRNYGNENGEKSGIDLSHYIFQETSYINYFDENIFKKINDFNSPRFCLVQNTERIFEIPFTISSSQVSINRLKNGTPSLVISLFPNKKSIVLN